MSNIFNLTSVFIVMRNQFDDNGRRFASIVMTAHRTRTAAEKNCREMEKNTMSRQDNQKYFYIIEEILSE